MQIFSATEILSSVHFETLASKGRIYLSVKPDQGVGYKNGIAILSRQCPFLQTSLRREVLCSYSKENRRGKVMYDVSLSAIDLRGFLQIPMYLF